MPEPRSVAVTAVAASAQLGGTERVLLDFANLAFEHDVVLRVLVPRDGPLVEILGKIGVPADVVPAPAVMLRGSQRPGALWSLPPALVGLLAWARRLRRHPFVRHADVIYTVAFKAHLAATVARLRPTVWHLHEFPPDITGGFWRWLARSAADGLITNSRAVAEAWGSEGKREKENGNSTAAPKQGSTFPISRFPRPPVVVPNGVNLDRFKPRHRTFWIHDALTLDRSRRLVGMPAVFARWKGQLEVVAAFRMIAAEFPEVGLVLVGGAIYDTVAERRFERELRFAHSHILPFQREVERTYPEFDLVIHYSTRPEAFGRVIVEAMACGVPVVAADEGGPREILGGGIGPRREAGWLAEPRNPEALARILRSALALPPEVLREVGEAGRRRAEDYFSWRRFAKQVAAALSDVAESKGKGEGGVGNGTTGDKA